RRRKDIAKLEIPFGIGPICQETPSLASFFGKPLQHFTATGKNKLPPFRFTPKQLCDRFSCVFHFTANLSHLPPPPPPPLASSVTICGLFAPKCHAGSTFPR
ncbi:hypothetical protein CDAR_401391, partial [Caerostris darwini]